MKIELKLGNSAGIVYGNCPAVFSRPGVTCETSCNVVCDIAFWWSPRTNQRACIVRALYLRERNVSAIRCWQIAGSWKECRRTESFLQTRFCTLRAGVIEMIAFETRATSFRNVIRANTNITLSIFHGKSGISPVTLQIKRNLSVKLEISRGLSLCTAWTSGVRSVNNSSNVKFPPVGEISSP